MVDQMAKTASTTNTSVGQLISDWNVQSEYVFKRSGTIGISFKKDIGDWTEKDDKALKEGFAYVPLNGIQSRDQVRQIALDAAGEVTEASLLNAYGMYGCPEYFNLILRSLGSSNQVFAFGK